MVNYWIGSHIVWLGRPDTALISVMVVNLWQNTPYVAVLLLAGLRSLPSEPVEAASIDGASRWQVFWHITLPLLRPYILVALLLRTIFEFRAFDNIYVMTSGGPANATMSLSMFTYLASFVRFDLSLGAAASWLMLLMCLLLCLFFIAVIRRREANLMASRRVGSSGVGSRRSKLVFAGSVYLGADRDDRGVPVPAALGHRPVAEDAAAGVRHAAAVRLVADAGELCRRAGPGRFPAGVRQQPGGVLGRGDPVDLRRRAGGVCIRALPVPRRLVPVLLAAGHAHAAADRGAGADVHPVQQARPDHDAAVSVILAYSTFSLPLVVWIMRGFFEDLPRELEESAWVDGASRYAAFRHVVLPLIRPGLVAASILSLQLAWNDFLFSAVLTNNATRTLPVLMAAFSGGDTGVDWGGMTASGVLVILPVLIFSFAAQRHWLPGCRRAR